MKKDLNTRFNTACELASSTNKMLPQDIRLQFYAYYKQATKGNDYISAAPSDEVELRNAFKLNAWFQLSQLTEDQAKKEYIKLVNKYLN